MKAHLTLSITSAVAVYFVIGASLAHEETGPTPAEFVTQAISPDEPVELVRGTALERRIRLAERARYAYDYEFDLSGLPNYQPKRKVSGLIRFWGNNYVGDSGLAQRWGDEFIKHHPDASLEFVLPTAAVAAPALYFGLADIGMKHHMHFYDDFSHNMILGYKPTGFSVITGSFDISGWQNSLAIVVHKDNPLERITMQQLDGVFGSQRAGGWNRTTWKPEYARGPEQNIRRWGQLGLTDDEWRKEAINTYGYSLRYATALEFSDKVLKGSDKWNENLLAFGNYVAPDGTRSLQAEQIIEHLQNDPRGIAYIRWQSALEGKVKVLSLAEDDQGPYYEFNVENVQERKYPLWGDQSFWVSVKPGERIEAKTAEFIRFVLSREGQQLVVDDGKYFPLPAHAVKQELARLKDLE
jgi:phosphate transport system substrate-binding protein